MSRSRRRGAAGAQGSRHPRWVVAFAEHGLDKHARRVQQRLDQLLCGVFACNHLCLCQRSACGVFERVADALEVRVHERTRCLAVALLLRLVRAQVLDRVRRHERERQRVAAAQLEVEQVACVSRLAVRVHGA